MTTNLDYDVIVVGGSYAGLASSMALGRALRPVLVIDRGEPSNIQTPQSHNFITHDGRKPAEIAQIAKQQVLAYESVSFLEGRAVLGAKTDPGFSIQVDSGKTFSASKLIFATGIRDLLPSIEGFAECWGISALHCPYCHGYEVRGKATAILANGDYGFEFSVLIANWTKNLTLLTNGASTLTSEQTLKLAKHGIAIVDTPVQAFEHTLGQLKNVVFMNGSRRSVEALYSRPPFIQHCAIPQALGCELTAQGYVKADAALQTVLPGIYVCGDNATHLRTVANAVAMGTTAGMMANRQLTLERF